MTQLLLHSRVPPALALLCGVLLAPAVSAQPVSHRGFVEARGFYFPLDALHDRQNIVIDLVAREELFGRPAPWLQLGAGVDLRANTGDLVDGSTRPDISDRGVKRPIVSVRRLTATVTRGPITVDAGKQFIRWGKTDIVTPTDRFAPRDFLNVVDSELFAVRGVRGAGQFSSHTVDLVWVPVFTPSRIPLLDKRWTVWPAGVPVPSLDERAMPPGSQAGLRWGYTGSAYEYSLSFFDGFNHLPVVEPAGGLEIALRFPSMRMYGADAAVPTRWLTIKGEAAYFTTSTASSDEYVLYVVQVERQLGEWLVIGGYAGEVVTVRRAPGTFAPDRGMTKSFVGRASYTIDPARSMALEAAVRDNLDGVYAKAEYSQAHGDHWRTTATAVVLQGKASDFFGQFRRNAHATVGVRYSF